MGEEIVLDFTVNHCGAAEWAWSITGANAPLACGVAPTSNGGAQVFDTAELQDGSTAGPVLSLVPPDGDNGVASGTYSSITHRPGRAPRRRHRVPRTTPRSATSAGRWWAGSAAPTHPNCSRPARRVPATRSTRWSSTLPYNTASFDFTFAVLINGTYSPDDNAYFVEPRIVRRPV